MPISAARLEPAYEPDDFGQVILAHDYLNQIGGAERVVLELSNIWPDAPIYTSLYRPGSTFSEFRDRDIRTTMLDRLPVDRQFRNLFPLYPSAFRALGKLDADLVISSSSGWAHAVRTTARAYHVVYCHSPARWVWGDYRTARRRHQLMKPAAGVIRAWDRNAARRADLYIVNSRTIQQQVLDAYGIQADVVHPPVSVERFHPAPRGDRLLVVSRLVGSKRLELIVDAATRLGVGLDVVGDGPERAELQRRAGASVTFHGRLDDDQVIALFHSCNAYCMPGKEDFGITLVEAQAAGKPVIAFHGGGALETVIDGVTGVFFGSYDADSVADAIRRCERVDTAPEAIAAHAARFSVEQFAANIRRVISARRRAARRHPTEQS